MTTRNILRAICDIFLAIFCGTVCVCFFTGYEILLIFGLPLLFSGAVFALSAVFTIAKKRALPSWIYFLCANAMLFTLAFLSLFFLMGNSLSDMQPMEIVTFLVAPLAIIAYWFFFADNDETSTVCAFLSVLIPLAYFLGFALLVDSVTAQSCTRFNLFGSFLPLVAVYLPLCLVLNALNRLFHKKILQREIKNDISQ